MKQKSARGEGDGSTSSQAKPTVGATGGDKKKKRRNNKTNRQEKGQPQGSGQQSNNKEPRRKAHKKHGARHGTSFFFGSARKSLAVLLPIALLVALCVWIYVDLIIVAKEASKIRPLTERAASAAAEAHFRAAEVAMRAQQKAAQAAEEMQHSLDGLSTYMENILFNKTTIDPTRPGLNAKERMSPHFPVVMIPGVVSTGLEIWDGRPCALKHFRMRIWGTVTMMQKLFLDKQCWLDHIMLDKATGLDPEGIKLRPAMGLEAADYLFPGYWVWGRLIQNLADIGYDSNNLFMAAYDWRLSFKGLQQRDQFFTKLKFMIELAYESSNHRKVVILTHSMGSNLMIYFLNWVQADTASGDAAGGESSKWVNKYIESWVNIAGPLLGVPKALASLVSGEMRDTAQLGALESYLIENFFSRRQRAEMMRSWGSIASMLPKGGDYIWGNTTFAPDGVMVKGHMISFLPEEKTDAAEDILLTEIHQNEAAIKCQVQSPLPSPHPLIKNITMSAAIDWLLDVADDPDFEGHIRSLYSYGVETHNWKLFNREPKYWSNPLETALPHSPNMTIYCLYGVGKKAERAYIYKRTSIIDDLKQTIKEKPGSSLEDPEDGQHSDSPTEHDVPFRIHNEVSDPENDLLFGVQDSEGDGTVPLMSLGYMCVEGWKRADLPYNPAGIKVTTREYPHQPSSLFSDLRGGPDTADHVDIMGNYGMTVDILHIVSNRGHKVQERVVSPIKEYVRGVDLKLDLSSE